MNWLFTDPSGLIAFAALFLSALVGAVRSVGLHSVV